MQEDNLRSKFIDGSADSSKRRRRWRCPDDREIAGYVDSTLTDARRSRMQRHLADCKDCRALVADVVIIRREADAPVAPTALLQRALDVVPQEPRRWSGIWAPVTALGTVGVCAMIAVMVLRHPERMVVPSGPAPAAHIESESGPKPPTLAPEREIVRNQASSQPSPSIISPKEGSAILRESLSFQWESVPHSLYYRVRIVTSEGEVVWEGESSATHLEPPKDAPIRNGKYFVLISAFMENGRIVKTDPVSFQIASSR